MTPTPILKTLLKKLGRSPLDEFPTVEFRLATETAPVEPPTIVASVSLAESEDAPRNAYAVAEIVFVLTFNSADFDNDEASAVIDAADFALCTLSAQDLNRAAGEIDAPVHFYFIKWTATDSPQPSDDGTLSVRFSFLAKVQF